MEWSTGFGSGRRRRLAILTPLYCGSTVISKSARMLRDVSGGRSMGAPQAPHFIN
jgi:hypothetical protein